METKTSTVTYVTVKNRNNGYTSYVLPNGVKRQFTIGQTRKIDLDELKSKYQFFKVIEQCYNRRKQNSEECRRAA